MHRRQDTAAVPGRAGRRQAADKPFFGENAKNDTDAINDTTAGKTETEEKSEEKKNEDMTYREQILAHMEEMAKKVKEGKVEPTFQTGAQSFTIKEWEKLLTEFDDAEEALQEQIKELIAEVEKHGERGAEAGSRGQVRCRRFGDSCDKCVSSRGSAAAWWNREAAWRIPRRLRAAVQRLRRVWQWALRLLRMSYRKTIIAPTWR